MTDAELKEKIREVLTEMGASVDNTADVVRITDASELDGTKVMLPMVELDGTGQASRFVQADFPVVAEVIHNIDLDLTVEVKPNANEDRATYFSINPIQEELDQAVKIRPTQIDTETKYLITDIRKKSDFLADNSIYTDAYGQQYNVITDNIYLFRRIARRTVADGTRRQKNGYIPYGCDLMKRTIIHDNGTGYDLQMEDFITTFITERLMRKDGEWYQVYDFAGKTCSRKLVIPERTREVAAGSCIYMHCAIGRVVLMKKGTEFVKMVGNLVKGRIVLSYVETDQQTGHIRFKLSFNQNEAID